jgi:hypothetical protein
MNELLHRASEITRPLSARLLDKIRVRDLVMADETQMRMQDDGPRKAEDRLRVDVRGARRARR